MNKESELGIFITSLEALVCACIWHDPKCVREFAIGGGRAFAGLAINYYHKEAKELVENVKKRDRGETVEERRTFNPFDQLVVDYYGMIAFYAPDDRVPGNKEFVRKLYKVAITTLTNYAGTTGLTIPNRELFQKCIDRVCETNFDALER